MKISSSPDIATQLRALTDVADEIPAPAVAAGMVRIARSAPADSPQPAAQVAQQRRALQRGLAALGPAGEDPSVRLAATKAKTILRTTENIMSEQAGLLADAVVGAGSHQSAQAPSVEVARAFLKQFMAAGTQAANKQSHNHWYANMGPGPGKTFAFQPSAENVEARAQSIAADKGVPVSDKHRSAAADQLAKEQKFTFGSEDGAPGAAGRIFAEPYDVLEQVGGYALEKANGNNAESIKAASLGLLASLSGGQMIDQTLSAADYRKALQNKFGDLESLSFDTGDGPSWNELSGAEQRDATAYFSKVLGEMAELSLGTKSYDELSGDSENALSTTHDVYVQMRASWLFDDDWGKSQAVPFAQLDKDTKDADLPPFLFALVGMVKEANATLPSDATRQTPPSQKKSVAASVGL